MSTVITKNLQIGADGTASNNFTVYQPASPDGTLRIGNGNTGTTSTDVALTSAGNVGIGTSAPAERLHVTSTTSIGVIQLGGTASTGYYSQINQNGNDLRIIANGDQAFRASLGTNNGSGNIAFFTAVNTTGNTERMRIDFSGRVTTPYQPLFSASDSRALNISSSVLTSSNCFDSIDYNVGRFTAPVAGFYDCTFHCADVSASGKDTNMRIRKNGVSNVGPLAEAYNQAGLGATNVFIRCIVQCAAGDYIDFEAARLNTVGSIQHKRFIIHLIG